MPDSENAHKWEWDNGPAPKQTEYNRSPDTETHKDAGTKYSPITEQTSGS